MSAVTLSHFTKDRFLFDRRMTYPTVMERTPFKPAGLWLSDESAPLGWSKWCRDERFRTPHLRVETQFEVDLSRWIVIKNPAELDEFDQKYGITDLQRIDWTRVKTEHAGILITPYIWSRRLTRVWYYGWDCASGCVWDLSTIREIGSTGLTVNVDSLKLEELEKVAMIEALNRTGGNRARAARLLGIGRSTLFDKIRKYGIKGETTWGTAQDTRTTL